MFWTFFGYTAKCFAVEEQGQGDLTQSSIPHSFNECYDWSTVMIEGNEEVKELEKCVQGGFETSGDFNTDHKILREDLNWAI